VEPVVDELVEPCLVGYPVGAFEGGLQVRRAGEQQRGGGLGDVRCERYMEPGALLPWWDWFAALLPERILNRPKQPAPELSGTRRRHSLFSGRSKEGATIRTIGA
jgi:hypothetical protein